MLIVKVCPNRKLSGSARTFMTQHDGKSGRDLAMEDSEVSMTNSNCLKLDDCFVRSRLVQFNRFDRRWLVHFSHNNRSCYVAHFGISL